MWKLIKYDYLYNWYYLTMLGLSFIIYTVLSIFNLQLTDAPEFIIDYWGGIYSIIIYAFIISTWGNRLKERRIRLHTLLPYSLKKQSLIRFYIALLPMLFITLYLLIIQLFLVFNWHNETGSMIGQLGVCFILLAGFIRGRDDWFSHWNFGKRTQAAFISVIIIQIVVVFLFLEIKELNKGMISIFGSDGFQYAKLIFPALGFIILTTTIFSYRKRKSYLM